jgi:hypothetical protein
MSPVTLFRHGACILYLSMQGDMSQATRVIEEAIEAGCFGRRVIGSAVGWCAGYSTFVSKQLTTHLTYIYLYISYLYIDLPTV